MITIFTDYYFPSKGGGGPMKSVKLLTDTLDCEFQIVTRNRDVDGQRFDKSSLLDKVKYTNLVQFWREYSLADVTYFNSCFSRRNLTLYPLFLITRKRIILAPRGELYIDNLVMKSTFAKKAVLALLSLLSRRITWHFTTQDEYEEASRLVTIKNYVVIPNLIDDKTYFPSIERHYDFIFVGRVVRKKRLHLAIDFIQNQSQYGDVNCLFCLIPEDSDYLNECMNQVRSNTFRVDIMHNCAPEELKDYYRRSKFILVPSLNENHGHVIFEGLYNGCMPLVSTNMYYAKILSDTFCVNFDNLEDKSFLDLEVTDSVLQLEIDKSQEFLGIKRSRENYKKLLCDQ